MNSEVYSNILSGNLQSKSFKLIEGNNDPKHTANIAKEKKWKVLDWPNQPPNLNPIEHPLNIKLIIKCYLISFTKTICFSTFAHVILR